MTNTERLATLLKQLEELPVEKLSLQALSVSGVLETKLYERNRILASSAKHRAHVRSIAEIAKELFVTENRQLNERAFEDFKISHPDLEHLELRLTKFSFPIIGATVSVALFFKMHSMSQYIELQP